MFLPIVLASFLLTSQPGVVVTPASAATSITAAVAKTKLIANDHILGSKKAKVVMVEYADLQCPFCKMHHDVMQQLVDEYDGDVAWVFRHFPLDAIHTNAQLAAEASECAAKQKRNDGFWQYVDTVYERQAELGKPLLVEIATSMDLNMNKFNRCLDKHQAAARVRRDYRYGQREQVSGTPTTVLIKRGGEQKTVIGAMGIELMRQEIDALLK